MVKFIGMILKGIKVKSQNRINKPQPHKLSIPRDSQLDTTGYLAWFLCCAGFSIHIWLGKLSSKNNNSFQYQLMFSIYLIGQSLLALGHLSTFLSLRFWGQVIAAVGYHLVFLSYAKFIPPYHISSICIFTLVCTSSIIIFIVLFKFYKPNSSPATYLQSEELCDLYYLGGAALGLITIIKVYIDTQNPIIYRAVFAALFGAANMFWPNLFPPQYFKILSRFSDCFSYIPWVVFAVEELDRLSSVRI